jgi:endonuclease YncB( thermonuclease family)
MGYAPVINIMGKTKRAISEEYEELEETAKEVGLNISIENTKSMAQSGKEEVKYQPLMTVIWNLLAAPNT